MNTTALPRTPTGSKNYIALGNIWEVYSHIGGCQNYGPFLGTLKTRCSITIGIQKGTMILTTTHISNELLSDFSDVIDGYGFLSGEYAWDSTRLQE